MCAHTHMHVCVWKLKVNTRFLPSVSSWSFFGFCFCFNILCLSLKLELTTLARLAGQIVNKSHGSFSLYGLVCTGLQWLQVLKLVRSSGPSPQPYICFFRENKIIYVYVYTYICVCSFSDILHGILPFPRDSLSLIWIFKYVIEGLGCD